MMGCRGILVKELTNFKSKLSALLLSDEKGDSSSFSRESFDPIETSNYLVRALQKDTQENCVINEEEVISVQNEETIEIHSQIIICYNCAFKLIERGKLIIKPPGSTSSSFLGESLRIILSFIGLKDGHQDGRRRKGETSRMSISDYFTSPPSSLNPLCLTLIKWNYLNLGRRFEEQIRTRALETLRTIFKSVKKSEIFQYWPAILPKSSIGGYCVTLADFFSTSPQCPSENRDILLGIFSEFFRNSWSFLQLAESKSRFSSFIPISLALAESLFDLHLKLLSLTESLAFSATSVTQILKTLQIIVDHTPYHKLKDGLLTKIRLSITQLLEENSNAVVQVSGLTLFSSLCALNKHPDIINSFDDCFALFMSVAFGRQRGNVDNNARYIAIQNLGQLTNVNVEAFLEKADDVISNVDRSLDDKDKSIVLHVLRLVRYVGRHIQGPTNPESQRRALSFWKEFLRPHIFQKIESRDYSTFKATFCDCLSEMGKDIFNQLPHERRNLCVSYLLGHSCEPEDNAVISSALRGVGMLITYQSNTDDVAFTVDSAAKLLDILNNPKSHRTVIVSATWAMANLTNALVLYEELRIDFPPNLIIQLLQKSTELANDLNTNMNIRANCVRSLGSLLNIVDNQNFQFDLLTEIFEEAIGAIILNLTKGKVMKVRWNACYAAGSIFKNEDLTIHLEECKFKLITTLIPMIENFPNFKVRINAAAALTCLHKREDFSITRNNNISLNLSSDRRNDEYFMICQTLMRALVTANNNEDADEIRHRNDLMDQICLTLCHLISLGTSSDLDQMNELALNYEDYLSTSFDNVYRRVSPEKSTVLIKAKEHWDKTSRSKSSDINTLGKILINNKDVLFL